MIQGSAMFYSSPEAARKIGVTSNKFRYLQNYLPVKPVVTNGGKNHGYLWPAKQIDRITPEKLAKAVEAQKGKSTANRAAALIKNRTKRKYVKSGKYAKQAKAVGDGTGFVTLHSKVDKLAIILDAIYEAVTKA